MKTTLITLSCGLLAAASIQAAELCKAPFDVVQPKVPDKLCRVTLNRQELGGEIDRRIQNLIYKNYMVIDLDGGWLNHFRNRTDRGGAGSTYYGIGKVLDAGSLFAAYTGDPKVAERTQYIMDQLRASRDPDGYLGFWKVEPNNHQNVVNWILHEQEYFNLALVRNYRTTENPQALADARVMADYIMRMFPANANGEHIIPAGTSVAGITEGFVELYRVTGDKKYLDFARNLQYEPHWYYLKPFDAWEMNIAQARYHVYVMLSHMYPDTELYRLIGGEDYLKKSLWMKQELLAQGRGGLLVTGSTSQGELFTYNQDGAGAVEESCVTAYLLRWIDSLMRLDGDMRYGDIMERTIYNALFGAQSPDGRRICYSTPFTGQRDFQQHDNFCCNGNFRRAVAELPQKVYYRTPDGGIALNLFTNSKKAFDVNGQTVTIRQETAYPNDGEVKLTFSTPKPVACAFQFRTPRWCQKITLRVNDEAPVTIDPLARKLGSYVLNRTWKDGDAVKLSMPMAWRFLRGRAVQDGRVVLLRGPVVYCVGKAQNAGLFAKCPDPRNLVIDPASIAQPTQDDSIRPGGLKAVAKVWLNPQRTGEQADVVLTEFIDPSGQEIYFRVPNLTDTSPVRLTDDEIVSWTNENVNAQVLQALYGPKATGDLKAMFEIRGDVVADMAANYVNPGGKTGVKAEFPDSTGGHWAFYNCKNGGLLSTAAASDVKQLDSRFKAFGSPLGFAYGLENQGDQLGFVSDYAPSDRQEDAWRVHYTADRFDQVLSAAERNEFLYTHTLADAACYNVFRWTPSADAQKKDITLCGTLFSNLGNGVQLRVIRWNDDTRSEILGTYNTKDLTTGKCGTAGFVLRLKPGETGKHLDFVLHNAGDHACDASAMKIQALTNVRQPAPAAAQSDVTDKVLAKFRNRLVTPLGRYAELFGAGTPGAQNTLKVQLKDVRDGKMKYLELPQDAALDLTEKPTP
jgi:DUF1680 family protein